MEPDDTSMQNLLYSLLSAERSYKKSQKVRACNYLQTIGHKFGGNTKYLE